MATYIHKNGPDTGTIILQDYEIGISDAGYAYTSIGGNIQRLKVGSTDNTLYFDGRPIGDFMTNNTETDLNAFTTPGYNSGTFSNNPANSSDTGTVMVVSGGSSTATTQYYIDSDGKVFSRYGSGDPISWNTWRQYGYMTYDAGTNILDNIL
jgi:hypothetical protein